MNNESIIRHGNRYRLRAKPGQEATLRRFAGCCRWIWNNALARQNQRHADGEKFANYVEMGKWITDWRQEHAFLKAAPVHALQSTLRDLEDSFLIFFKKAGGRPGFKRHGDYMAFSEPDVNCFQMDEANSRIRLPKVGWMRYRHSRDLQGQVRSLTVSCDPALGWHVSVMTESRVERTPHLEDSMGAGDRGVNLFLAQADGKKTDPLNAHTPMLRRLKQYQRACARRVEAQKKALGIIGALPKGTKLPVSNRLKVARTKLNKMHSKVARERSDYLHKLSTAIADKNAIFVLEDLKVKNMTASAKGGIDMPGVNVKQKSGLNRSILDQGWSMFNTQLTYKLKERGGMTLYVPPQYTSQKCSCCGHTEKLNRKGEKFLCLSCNYTEHADVNAAKNILAAGYAVLAGVEIKTYISQAYVEDRAQSGRLKKRKPAEDLQHVL
jgi:putative transposase